MTVFQIAQSTGLSVALFSAIALLVYVVLGAAITRDANYRGMTTPPAWGITLFLALLLGTLSAGLLGALVGGLLVGGLYLAVRD